jgi:hypothetical protein
VNLGVQGHVIPMCDIPLLYCILMRKFNATDNTFNLNTFTYTSRQIKLRISYDEKYLLLGSNAV